MVTKKISKKIKLFLCILICVFSSAFTIKAWCLSEEQKTVIIEKTKLSLSEEKHTPLTSPPPTSLKLQLQEITDEQILYETILAYPAIHITHEDISAIMIKIPDVTNGLLDAIKWTRLNNIEYYRNLIQTCIDNEAYEALYKAFEKLKHNEEICRKLIELALEETTLSNQKRKEELTIICNKIIEVVIFERHTQIATQTLDHLHDNKLITDDNYQKGIASAIYHAGATGNFEEATAGLESADDRILLLDGSIYNALIFAAGATQHFEAALATFKKIKKSADPYTYATFMHAATITGHFNEVLEAFGELDKLDSLTAETCGEFLYSASINDRLDDALYVFNKAKSLGFLNKLNPEALRAFIIIAGETKNFGKAKEAFETAKESGKADTYIYKAFLEAAIENSAYKDLTEAFDEAMRLGRIEDTEVAVQYCSRIERQQLPELRKCLRSLRGHLPILEEHNDNKTSTKKPGPDEDGARNKQNTEGANTNKAHEFDGHDIQKDEKPAFPDATCPYSENKIDIDCLRNQESIDIHNLLRLKKLIARITGGESSDEDSDMIISKIEKMLNENKKFRNAEDAIALRLLLESLKEAKVSFKKDEHHEKIFDQKDHKRKPRIKRNIRPSNLRTLQPAFQPKIITPPLFQSA